MKASSPARHTVRERDEQCHHSRGRSGRPPRRAGAVDRLARVYDVWAAFAESKARRCAFERADVTGHDDILEVAVGTGQMFAALAQANTKGTTRGIDVSPGMLTKVRRRTGGLDRRVELQLAEARALPFDDRSFDLVVVGYLFDLLPETDFGLVFAEINRVLRDSGRVVVVDMTIAERRTPNAAATISAGGYPGSARVCSEAVAACGSQRASHRAASTSNTATTSRSAASLRKFCSRDETNDSNHRRRRRHERSCPGRPCVV
jgi:ubiquinone/menaquinone biosynthesis C-methylase UbiE